MKTMWWTVGALIIAAAAGHAGKYDVVEKSTIRESWTFPAGTGRMEVSVDNIEGSISVTGHNGNTVELLADKTIRAESAERVQLAKEEVRLEISRNNELFEAFVDHPGREREGRRNRGRRSDGYRVGFDFVLKVPASASLYLRTINEGEIRVQDVAGDFDVNNINGGIEIIETAGSGRAYALNGNLKVLFRSNPTRDCYFGSLNGKVDLFFQPALAADLRLKTFNGEIYTDFDVTSLPASPFKQERRNGRYVYRASEFFGVRIGQGGPELKLENFNGDICIHERKQ